MNKKAFALIVSVVCGCTLGPDYKRPENVSDKQIEASLTVMPNNDTAVNGEWYKAFGDERLNELIELALIDSPSVNIAIQKLRQARLALEIQGVEYYPTIDLNGTYTKLKPSKNTSTAFKESYYQAGLDVSWELDLWGAGRRLTEKARALAQAAAEDLNNVRVTLKAEVINNYISLRQAQEQLRLLNKNLILQQKIVMLSADKAAAGLISETDLRQIQYATDTIKMQIPSLVTAAAAYKNNLTLLTGKLPEQLNTLLDDTTNNIIQGVGYSYDLSALYLIPAGTIRNRPDVRQAELNLIAQNAMIGKATADLFPTVSFSGFFGFQADQLPKLPNHKSRMFSLTPGIDIPLIHWGALIKQVEVEKEATKEAAFVYQSTVLNAVTEVKNAMITVSEQYVENTATQNALDKMRDISALTLAQYDSGLISLGDSLNTFQDLLTAQTNLAQGNGAIYRAVVGFYKSLGY